MEQLSVGELIAGASLAACRVKAFTFWDMKDLQVLLYGL